MKYLFKNFTVMTLCLVVLALVSPLAQAHLMKAQHGTLNIFEHGIYMVLSLPASAFDDIDENNDGKLSMMEFNNQRSTIIESITNKITLSNFENNISLEGIMLSPEVSHDSSDTSISQLVILGKFSVHQPNQQLIYTNNLYGKNISEQMITITATRQSDGKRVVFELMSDDPSQGLSF